MKKALGILTILLDIILVIICVVSLINNGHTHWNVVALLGWTSSLIMSIIAFTNDNK